MLRTPVRLSTGVRGSLHARGAAGLLALAVLAGCDSPTNVMRQAGADQPSPKEMSTRRPLLTPASQLSGDVLVGPWASQKPAARAASAGVETGASVTTPFYYLLWQNTKTGDRVMWPMSGTSRAGADIMLPREDTVWSMAAIADFTGDGDPEILFQNKSTGNRGMWSLKGTTWNDWIQLYGENPVWDFAAAADFTGDSQPDILLQNTSTGERGFWVMDHAAYRGYTAAPTEQPVWRMVAAADFTGDAKPDVLFENESTGQRGIWQMNGTAYQSWVSFPTEQTVWEMAAAHDVTGDGQPDIFFQNKSTGLRGWWIMKGTQYQTWVGLGTVSPDWDIVGAFTPTGTHVDPQAPSNLTTASNPTGPVNLQWADNTQNEQGFEVQRSVKTSDNFVVLAQLPANTTTYVDPRSDPTYNTFYRVRACGATGCTGWSNVAMASGTHLTVNTPTPTTVVGDTLPISVSFNNGKTVTSLTASVDGRSVALTKINSAPWTGTLLLTGLASGPKELLLIETHSDATVDTSSVLFTLDRRPVVTIAAPLAGTALQTHTVHVSASCTDDVGPCVKLQLFLSGSGTPLAQGGDHLEADVTLPDGASTVDLMATDARGQTTRRSSKVFVETDSRWTRVATAGIEVIQADSARILYADSANGVRTLNILDPATGTKTQIFSQQGSIPYYGYLTPQGAVFATWVLSVGLTQAYDWRNGTLVDLGLMDDKVRLLYKGHWAAYERNGILVRRDETTGTNATVTDLCFQYCYGMNATGDVCYSDIYGRFHVYHDGVTTDVASCRKDGVLENNGWDAFQRGVNGVSQIILRTPTGEERQVTDFTSTSTPVAVGPNGQLVFASGGSLYYLPLNGTAVRIGNDFLPGTKLYIGEIIGPRAFWIGGELYIALGSSLFHVVP